MRGLPTVSAMLRGRPTGWIEWSSAAWTAGEAVYLVGLLVYAYKAGGSPAVALVALLQSLPSVVFAPIAMVAAGRMRREALLRWILLLRVVAVGLLTILIHVRAPFLAVVFFAALDAIGSTLLRPVRSSLIPMLARSPAELIAANVAITTGMSGAALVGPGLAAVLLATVGIEPTFVLGTGLLGIALLSAGRMRVSGDPGATRTQPISWAGILSGSRGLGPARSIIAIIVGQRFVRGMLSVLVVATAIDLLGAGDEGTGILNAAIGFGGIVGSLASASLIGRRWMGGAFTGAIAVWGVTLAAPALLPALLPAAIFLAVSGGAKAVLEVAGMSLLQRTVRSADLPQVLALLESFITLSLAAGAVTASLLVSALGPGGALLAGGGLMICLAAVGWPAIRTADDASVVPERELVLLRGVAFFRPLQLATIERLAGALQDVAVSQGTTVVRTGEPGDRFYIVESGSMAAEIDGTVVRRLGPGDAFGEIALLRSVPRTATVVALEDTRLVALARDDFLAAVTGHEESFAAADGVVRSRLGC